MSKTPITTTRDGEHASTTGDWSHASTTGDWSQASATGYQAHALSAEGAAQSTHGVAVGRWVRLTDTSCDALVLPSDADRYHPYLVSKDDGWQVGVWITMDVDGWVVERPDVLLLGDGRGYTLRFDGKHYRAGCRQFTAEQAIKHWSNPEHHAPHSARLLLAEVLRHSGRTDAP